MLRVSYYINGSRFVTEYTDVEAAYREYCDLQKDFVNVDLKIVIEDVEYLIIWTYSEDFIESNS